MSEGKTIMVGGEKAEERKHEAAKKDEKEIIVSGSSATKKTRKSTTKKTTTKKTSTKTSTKKKTTKKDEVKEEVNTTPNETESNSESVVLTNDNFNNMQIISSDMDEETPTDINTDNIVIDPVSIESSDEVKEEVKEEVHNEGNTATSENESNDSNSQTPPNSIVTAGDRNCYVYFAVNYTREGIGAQPLSIALVGADGNYFYAEFNDYNMKEISPEVFKNVLQGFINAKMYEESDIGTIQLMVGDTSQIKYNLIKWLDDNYTNKKQLIQFVTDKNTFAYPILLYLLVKDEETTILPESIVPACFDLNQDLASALVNVTGVVNQKNYLPTYIASGVDRLEMVNQLETFKLIRSKNKIFEDTNNALTKAFITKSLHQNIWQIEKSVKYEDESESNKE